MSYSVLTAQWLPVRLADGSERSIAPWQITENIDTNPVVEIIHPRPDFTGSAREILIGVFQVLLAPATAEERLDRLRHPPTPDMIRKVLAPWAGEFDVDGGQSSFLQEMGGVPAKEFRPIDSLLMDGPGENTRKLNKDFFVRRDETSLMCPRCTMLALGAKMFYASGTGPGFRTSPRGGGPLTTLVEFTDSTGRPAPLWHAIYANVLPLSELGCDALNRDNAPLILPWLAQLRVSKAEKADVPTTYDDAHPLQIYFPLPARAEIIWQNLERDCPCDVCGSSGRRIASGWRTAQYGVMYSGFEHPLTPYRTGQKGEKISIKPKLDGLSYPQWFGAAFGIEGTVARSRNIRSIEKDLKELPDLVPRVRAYGFQMDNASALCWHEALMPFIPMPDHLRTQFSAELSKIVSSAQAVGSVLVSAVKEGLFRRPGDVSGDLSYIYREFIAGTTDDFNATLQSLTLALDMGTDTAPIKEAWLATLQNTGIRMFDRHAPVHVAEERNLRRLMSARRKFMGYLFGKKIYQEIDLPMPSKAA